jgi:ribose-phosphate pyrophosphokinase
MRRELKIFTGTAHPELGEAIGRYLGFPVGRAHLARFSDGEVWYQIHDNVRGADVFVIQPTSPPVNENLMELLLMLDAFKRSSASRLTAVIPYYGYGRQDRKDKPRVPISAKLVADLLSTAGTDRVLTMDLHAAQIQGFFDVPVDHLFAAPVIIDHVSKLDLPDLTVVSPDAGGVERARAYAKRLDAALAIVDKRRDQPNVAEVHHVIGEVEGRPALIVDDIVDTAGTDRVLTMDLHAAQIQGFFDVPVDHLFAAPVIIDHVSQLALEDLIVVSPDAGGVERARAYAKRLDAALAIVDKRRDQPNVAEVHHVIGDVEGRTALIVDDIVDTAGTLTKVAEAIKISGAREVIASCSHAVLSGHAMERIEKSPLSKLIITDSMPLAPEKRESDKIVVLTIAELLARAIKNIHEETSVTSLFV